MRELDAVQRHVFAAVRFVDGVTGAPVAGPLRVSSPQVELTTNRSGLFVLRRFAAGVASTLMTEAEQGEFVASRRYVLELDSGAPPPSATLLTLSVSDPQRRYLDRRCALRLVPRAANDPSAVPAPFDRDLLPAPTAIPGPGHAVVRVTVNRNNVGMPGALVQVQRQGETPFIARGMTNALGDALVLIPRLPVSTWVDADNDTLVDPGEVTTTTTNVRFTVTVDEDALDAQGRLLALPEPDLIPLAPRRTRRFQPLAVQAGGTYRLTFNI